MSSAALKAAATGAVTADEARNPYEAFKRQLEGSRSGFLALLGNANAVDRFVRVVLNAVMANPELLEVNRRSLVGAALRAAQDGLLPDGREAVFNVYNTKTSKRGEPDRWEKCAQYLPMVGGLIKKLYEGGEVTYVDAVCVYNGDVFRYTRGDEPKIIHEPKGEGGFADIVAVYCIVKLKNGEIKREVMFRQDIERVRGASKSKDNGPWVTWFDQQAIKSVIKRIYKQLPRTDAFESIAQADNLASGYGDLAGQAVTADVRPAPEAAPQLQHQPADTIDFGGMTGEQIQPDPVPAQQRDETPQPPAQPPRRAPRQSAPSQPGRIDAPLDKTLAQLLQELERAPDSDMASLVLDTARHLPEPEYNQLIAAYRERFGEG